MRIGLVILLFILSGQLYSQEEVKVEIEVSADTIYMDNAFRLRIVVKNGNIESMDPLEMTNFDLLQGPSRSSSMSIINGVRSSEEAITYYFRPTVPGTYSIPSTSLVIGGSTIATKPFNLIVVDNPEGWHQDPNTGQIEGRPVKTKVSKRKRYRI